APRPAQRPCRPEQHHSEKQQEDDLLAQPHEHAPAGAGGQVLQVVGGRIGSHGWLLYSCFLLYVVGASCSTTLYHTPICSSRGRRQPAKPTPGRRGHGSRTVKATSPLSTGSPEAATPRARTVCSPGAICQYASKGGALSIASGCPSTNSVTSCRPGGPAAATRICCASSGRPGLMRKMDCASGEVTISASPGEPPSRGAAPRSASK